MRSVVHNMPRQLSGGSAIIKTMHERLVSYLQDNRDQIIENWLLEAEIPAPDGSAADSRSTGIVPLAFLSHAFDTVIALLQTGHPPLEHDNVVHLDDFLGLTAACRQRCFGGRVCIELHDSGLKAFLSVFAEDWDAEHEFNEFDRELFAKSINQALAGLFSKEIEACQYKNNRADCPFVATSRLPAKDLS